MQTPIQAVANRKIGSIEGVTANSIRVSIDPEAPQGVALSFGTPMRFPRVNGFVLMPVESGAVVGLIHSLGIERSQFPRRPGLKDYGLVDLPYPSRVIQVTPLGVLRAVPSSSGLEELEMERGVQALPSVGDLVLLPTEREVRAIVETTTAGPRIRVGRSPLAPEASVYLSPDRLFARHIAVLGNTGSGKSCSVAGLVRWSLEEAQQHLAAGVESVNGRVVVLDPNGEYTDAFSDLAGVKVFRVEADSPENQLRVPAWLWNGQEWAAFSAAAPGVQRPILQRALRDMRAGRVLEDPAAARLARLSRAYLRQTEESRATGLTAYQGWPGALNFGERCSRCSEDLTSYEDQVSDDATVLAAVSASRDAISGIVASRHYTTGAGQDRFNDFGESDVVAVESALRSLCDVLPGEEVDLSVPSEDAPLPFDVGELASHIELLAHGQSAQAVQFTAGMALRIRTMLGDVRMGSITGASESDESLVGWLNSYLGGAPEDLPHISVIDLSLVPAEILHVVAAVMTRVVFEALQRYKRLHHAELPTVLVLEEAHHFIHRDAAPDATAPTPAGLCKAVFERVAREGRKFGLGLVLSSQRPSELSATVLSQCNTFLLHRTVNDRDQQLIRHLVPDNISGLVDELPSLPTQHAIVVGLAVAIPLLVEMRHLPKNHRPSSGDPDFWKVWTGELDRPVGWEEVAQRWTESP